MDQKLILGILIGAVAMYFLLHLIWHLGCYLFAFFVGFQNRNEGSPDSLPKTLKNMEKMLLPQVSIKYPDLDLSGLKEQICREISAKYGSHEGLQIHDIALTDCITGSSPSSLLFQAAVSWTEKKQRFRHLEICAIPEAAASDDLWVIKRISEI